MKIKFKKLDKNAKIPHKAHTTDAGFDLVCTSKEYDTVNNVLVFGTGLAIQLPDNHVGFLVPRSSVFKTGLSLANSCGILDAGYSGEIKFNFICNDRLRKNYEIGDRIGQLIIMPYPQVEFEQVDELEETERGSGGFGSSGR